MPKFSVDPDAREIVINYSEPAEMMSIVKFLAGILVRGERATQRLDSGESLLVALLNTMRPKKQTPSQEIADALGAESLSALGPKSVGVEHELEGTGFELIEIRTKRKTSRGGFWIQGPRFTEAYERFVGPWDEVDDTAGDQSRHPDEAANNLFGLVANQ